LLDPEQNPKNLYLIESKIGIADCYFFKKDWEQAIPAYQDAISFIETHPQRTDYIDSIPYSIFQMGEAYYRKYAGIPSAFS